MSIVERLNNMTGRTFNFNEALVKVVSWKMGDMQDETILVTTDSGIIRIPFTEADEKLVQFKPLPTSTAKMGTTMADMPVLSVDRQVLVQLKDMLLDNIEQVKKDKTYIPQADAISKNIGQIIDLAKVEISMINTLEGINKGFNRN